MALPIRLIRICRILLKSPCSDNGTADPQNQGYSPGAGSVAAPWRRGSYLGAGSEYIFKVPLFVLLEVNFDDEISFKGVKM